MVVQFSQTQLSEPTGSNIKIHAKSNLSLIELGKVRVSNSESFLLPTFSDVTQRTCAGCLQNVEKTSASDYPKRNVSHFSQKNSQPCFFYNLVPDWNFNEKRGIYAYERRY